MYQVSEKYKELVYQEDVPHILNVYLGESLQKMNADIILGLKITHKLLTSDEFAFGKIPSRMIELQLHKSNLPDEFNNIYIETGVNEEVVPIGYFTLESVQEDDDTITIKAVDNMIKFEVNYDGSTLNYPCNLMTVLTDICNKVGVELGSTSFLNQNAEIAVYDNAVSARTYLSYIAEQAGGFAFIGRDGKLYIKTIGEDIAELPIQYFQDFKWGEQFKVSRVRYEDGVQLFEAGDKTNNTIYINQENMYIVDKEQIDNIHNKYKDFNCYSFEGNSIIDPALDIGDLLLIDGKYVIYQGDMDYVGKFKANISSKIQAKTKEETMVRTPSQKVVNRRVQSQINQAEGKIGLLVEETNELQSQVTDITTTKATLEGTEIRIDDGAEEPIIKLEVDGRSIQDGTPTPETPVEIQSVGDDVNLFNGNYTLGTINSEGAERDATTSLRSDFIELKANTDYIFSSPDNAIFIRTLLYDENKTFIKTVPYYFTTTENKNYVRFVISGTNTDTRIKLQKGTVATAYSEYGKGTVEIKQSGKNLLNVSNEFIVTKAIWDISIDMPIGTYTLSVNEITTDGTVDKFLFLFYYDDGTSLSKFLSSTNKSLTFNIEKQIVEVNIYSQSSNASSTDVTTTYKNLMISKEGGDYKPYKTNNYGIPLSQPLRSLPNGVCDTIEEDGIHRRVGSVVLNGSEKWYFTQNYMYILKDILDLPQKSQGVGTSTHLIYKTTGQDIGTFRLGNSYAFMIFTGYTDVEEWKAWLSENPIQVDYELAEEVIEPFDEEQQEVIDSISTMLGTQYFTCDANMRITYVRNNVLSDTYATIMKLNSEVTQTKDTILSTVSKTLEAYDTTEEVNSKIEQKADSITSTVSQTYATKSEYEDEINVQNQKISQVTQTVDELNSKIQDIADITTFGESMYAKVELDSINESEPIQITVKPTVENISYLYPHDNLYPSDDLFLKDRKIRFTNKTDNTYIDYILPDDLLIAPDGTYDEFYLGYDEQICQVTKRCQYNTDGTVSKLEKEEITSYEYPKIELKDGDYTIELLGYTNAYLSVRLMAQNIYTTQFATKSEVKSEISQKADEVNISVDKKLSNYSTTTQMNSAINATANAINLEVRKKVNNEDFTGANIMLAINGDTSSAVIGADKIDIEGKAVHFKTDISVTVGPFTNEDRTKMINYLTGKGSLTQAEIQKCDINGDGKISSADVVLVTKAITNGGYYTFSGYYEINPYSYDKSIRIYDNEQNRFETILSLVYNYINYLYTGGVNVDGQLVVKNEYGQMFSQSMNDRFELYTDGDIRAENQITCNNLVQSSLLEKKKNFERLENGLDIVKNTDIYKYNLKSQKDTDKKHIGFVIGDNCNYSKEITSQNNDGVDTYSMISVAYKAIQEQQELIEQLQNEIKELKGEK